MRKIPLIVPIEEDELTYSWLYRMMIENSFEDIKKFLNIFVYDEAPIYRIQYDLKHLERIGEILDLPEIDILEIFMKTSLYPFYSIFLTPPQQTNYLNSIFRNLEKNKGVGYQNNKDLIPYLNICPICKEIELKEKGYFYFHRSHQLPGVHVCHTHKCTLLRYSGTKGNEFNDNSYSELNIRDDLEIEHQYSLFVKNMLDKQIDSNLYEVNQILNKELYKRNFTFNDIPTLLKNSKFDSLFSKHNYDSFIRKTFKSRNNKSFVCDVVLTLMFLFGQVENIPIAAKDCSPQFLETLESEGYVLESKYNDNIIVLHHKECDNVFICSGSSFNQGWRCPKCDRKKDFKDVILRVISKIDDGSYEMLDAFTGLGVSTRFIHKKCGSTFYITPGELIFADERCKCSRSHSYEYVKKQVEIRKNCKLLNFDSVSNMITVKDIYCGHIYTVPFHEFLEDRRCRICHPVSYRTENSFKAKMKDLVGNDYEIVGDFKFGVNHKMKFLHKKCNQITEMSADRFIHGHRCKHCTEDIHTNKFKKFIFEVSNKRYEMIKQRKDCDTRFITIRDNVTFQELELYKPLVLQEVCRPTSSPVLPFLNKTGYTPPPTYIYVEIFNHLLMNFKTNEFITAKKVKKYLPLDRVQLHKGFKKLESKDVITKIDKGIYKMNYTHY